MGQRHKKDRADRLLFQQGLAESREQAARFIMAGQAYLLQKNGEQETIDKAGRMLDVASKLEVKVGDRFVGRGGGKLLTALEFFQLDVRGWVALDVGASTGGFTDCLLQMGAERVYALDVGYGQLHWKLRRDPRVVNLERINIRRAGNDLLPEKVDLVTVDCSFISLRVVLPACLQFLNPDGLLLSLIKPQFELQRGSTSKGVVRSLELQQTAVEGIRRFVRGQLNLLDLGVVPSSIKGPKGNQEYLALFRYSNQTSCRHYAVEP